MGNVFKPCPWQVFLLSVSGSVSYIYANDFVDQKKLKESKQQLKRNNLALEPKKPFCRRIVCWLLGTFHSWDIPRIDMQTVRKAKGITVRQPSSHAIENSVRRAFRKRKHVPCSHAGLQNLSPSRMRNLERKAWAALVPPCFEGLRALGVAVYPFKQVGYPCLGGLS